MVRYFLLILFWLWAEPGIAETYSNRINGDGWRAVSSVFECRVEHKIPFYGDAVIRTRAGEASALYLRAKSSRWQAGDAEIIAKSPVWRSQIESYSLGTVPVKKGTRPLWLNTQHTERILAELNRGMEVELSRDAWYADGSSPPATLSMTSIGFRKAYRQYLNCLTGLLPANFDQMKRTALYFSPGETDELANVNASKLDKILKLVKHDKKIRLFFIDGHTDSDGDRAENLDLSKTRANLVKDYLLRRGIPEDWITERWHGERYPVASNGTASGRAKNRRVTVRIERIEEVEVLPLASE